jgi:hypothetical protein
MPAKRGFDRGTTFHGPLRTKFKPEGQSREFEDTVHLWNPRLRIDRFEDFEDEVAYVDVDVDLYSATGLNTILVTTGSVTTGSVAVPRGGVLVSAAIVAKDALAANDTNYLTFALTNKLASGSGSTAMLAATAANTTQLTGGTGITAVVGRSLTVHGTAANLRVAEGDVLQFTSTVTGTLANASLFPKLRLRFATLPTVVKPRITRTAGSPLVQNVANSANGEVICQLDATNEAQVAGFDFGDQLVIPATRAPFFSCRFKMSAAPSAVQRAVIGLASAYTATLDNTTALAWFRIDGSNSTSTIDVRCETDDNTTDRDDQASGGVTLTADTYYVLSVDLADPGAVRFWVNDNVVAVLNAKDFALTHLLQPIILLQKDSGTGIPSITIDWVRCVWTRF